MATNWQIDIDTLSVLCDCSQKSVLSACNDYRAVIVKADVRSNRHGNQETALMLRYDIVKKPWNTWPRSNLEEVYATDDTRKRRNHPVGN